jgi:hydroxymethylpyrimidine/phosphomethylpyrimidine kinase
MTHTPAPTSSDAPEPALEAMLSCVVAFNVNDPSGAGGLSADLTAMSSASCHVLPIVTGAYVRDTRQVHHHLPLDAEAIEDQARCALEDMTASTFKVGFAGSAEALGTIAEILTDYSDVPVVSYMPELAWWDEDHREHYLDAFADLVLPQTTVLVGNHHTLCRWLLPDWADDKLPGPRDVAQAAAQFGTPYTLVTGMHAPDQYLESHLSSPETVLASARYERFDATFTGAGDTLSAALAALLANENDLQVACAEALTYLDQCLDAGFHPGMGHAVPDRLFWAHDEPDAPSPDSLPTQET